MKLHYHQNRDGIRNFGDDLNPWLWSRTLAAELDDDATTMFLGIGTLLNDRLPPAPARVVFGTGAGIGGAAHVDHSWTFYAVRGPLSAKALGLEPEVALTDPAILVSHFAPQPPQKKFDFAYMPHYRSACETWRRACERIGFGYIDPRQNVDDVLQAVQSAKILLAEAMHGAIIADTLRVPWIAVRSRDKILRFKWEDWCTSMGLTYAPAMTATLYDGRSTVARTRSAAKGLVASAQLLRASRCFPTLSSDAVFWQRRAQYDELLERFRRDVRAGRFRPAAGALNLPLAYMTQEN